MTMNNVKQIFQNKFTNLGGKLKLDKNDDHLNNTLPPYSENLYLSAKINKEICNDLYKKMASVCVINYNALEDKKTKKNSWETLSTSVSESEKKITDDLLSKEILTTSIKTFEDLSRNEKEFEKSLSLNVIKYFQDISEDNSLSNVKKTITSLTKDMKANSERVQNLQEQVNNQVSEAFSIRKSADISSAGSTENKLVNAQLAEENSEKELDTKKDLYLTKLFCSEAEKLTMAVKMLEFFKEHLDYYIECKNILTKCIPELQTIIDNNRKNHVFHLSLEDHAIATNRNLSYVLETCIQELDNEETLQEEGLFRISGSKSKLDLLKNALNLMRVDEYVIKSCDSAVFAGVLKQYLRELPIPLMTFTLYDKWCEVGTKIRQNDVEGSKELIKECLSQMPTFYYDNLVYLMQFLKKIAENESINKMNSSNLALMLGPNLIRNKSINDSDDSDASRVMMLGSPGPAVLDFMITFFYDLFPDVPVYTPSKTIICGKSPHIKIPDKDFDKSGVLKSPRPFGDNDSQSSAELLSEDYSTSNNDISNSLKADSMSKSIKDSTAVKPRPPRKPLAPPPPVAKANIPEISVENISDEIAIREKPENRPVVKKRTSILVDKVNPELSSGNSLNRRMPSTGNYPKPAVIPSVPSKKPNASLSLDLNEKSRTKTENQPPKRPNNPPPPIPPFEKLKETLDNKLSDSVPSKMEPKKLYPPTIEASKSIDAESEAVTAPIKTHSYSNSDCSTHSTTF